jgi:hypothetical protein
VTTVLRRFTCHAPACVWALCGVGTETFCLRYLTDSMSALVINGRWRLSG